MKNRKCIHLKLPLILSLCRSQVPVQFSKLFSTIQASPQTCALNNRSVDAIPEANRTLKLNMNNSLYVSIIGILYCIECEKGKQIDEKKKKVALKVKAVLCVLCCNTFVDFTCSHLIYVHQWGKTKISL